MSLSIELLASLHEAASSAYADGARIGGHLPPEAESPLDKALQEIVELTLRGPDDPLRPAEELQLLAHLGVVAEYDIHVVEKLRPIFASAREELARVVQDEQALKGARLQRRAEQIAGVSLTDGVLDPMGLPFLVFRLDGTTAPAADFEVEDVLRGLGVAGLLSKPESELSAEQMNDRADQIARHLADVGVYKAPFDSWRIRLAVEDGGIEEGVRRHLSLALAYRGAYRRFVDPEKDRLVVLVGRGEKDGEEKLRGLPTVKYLILLQNLNQDTIERFTSVPGVARGEPGKDGTQESQPGDWRRNGNTIVPRNGFIDPAAGAPNVLVLDLETEIGNTVLSNLLNASLEQAIRTSGTQRWMVDTERLMVWGSLEEALQERSSGSVDLVGPGGGGSPGDGDLTDAVDERPYLGSPPRPADVESARRVKEFADAALLASQGAKGYRGAPLKVAYEVLRETNFDAMTITGRFAENARTVALMVQWRWKLHRARELLEGLLLRGVALTADEKVAVDEALAIAPHAFEMSDNGPAAETMKGVLAALAESDAAGGAGTPEEDFLRRGRELVRKAGVGEPVDGVFPLDDYDHDGKFSPGVRGEMEATVARDDRPAREAPDPDVNKAAYRQGFTHSPDSESLKAYLDAVVPSKGGSGSVHPEEDAVGPDDWEVEAPVAEVVEGSESSGIFPGAGGLAEGGPATGLLTTGAAAFANVPATSPAMMVLRRG